MFRNVYIFFFSLFCFCQFSMALHADPMQKTLSIIKPDAVANNQIGPIIALLEKTGLKVIAIKMVQMTTEQAQAFYGEHKDRPFFKNLVSYMTSGPVVVQVLEGDNAVEVNRTVMGPTNPKDAAPGTIRAEFGQSIEQNAVHGSDSPQSARREISFFFQPNEIFSK